MNRTRSRTRLAAVALSALAIVPITAGVAEAKPKKKGVAVKVMTRNLYLGADLTPAIEAANAEEFVDANGAILRSVTATDFRQRAKALAAEIRAKRPHLVGLQEVALWREAPPDFGPAVNNDPSAKKVRYDFLKLLLGELQGRKGYRVAVVQKEFDFEAPANEDGDDNTGSETLGGEVNGRLTMRDAILYRKHSRVKLSDEKSGTFGNLLTVRVANVVDVSVTRGWTAVNAKVRGGKKFRFVNAHLEAFDDETQTPSIRQLQARELVRQPARSKLNRTVLLGDFNSDDDTVSFDDQKAYREILSFGFRERSTASPLSCCLSDPLLRADGPGSISDFDHQVDHVMTNRGKRYVKLLSSSVTGLEPVGDLWPSDHAGVFSKLRIR